MSLAILRGFSKWKPILEHAEFNHYRQFCSQIPTPSPQKPSSPVDKRAALKKELRQNVRQFVFQKYIDAIKDYDKVLEKRFPSAMHVYRVFVVGIKDFYTDMKQLIKITRIINTSEQGLRSLTRKELELYYQMPKDMRKVAPVIILSALPFANYVIFPLAYYFPRHLLCSHFWSIQQRFEFNRANLEECIKHNKRVYRFMQSKLVEIKDDPHYEEFKRILGLIGSGLHATPQEILSVKAVFTKKPYELYSLPGSHLKQLCSLHGIKRGISKRYSLADRAYIIHHMDLAIRREGGVHNMPSDALQHACYLRGLNTTSLTNAEMIEWLNQWVEVSIGVDGSNISMFLYLPILLTYNHPNNWKLLHT